MNTTNLVSTGLVLAQQSATNAVEQQSMSAGTPPASAPASQPAPWWTSSFMPLMLILLMAWLLIFRPKNKTEKQRVQMLSALKKGDRIQTIGGVLGTVVDVRDDEVVVKVDETSNAKVTFTRNAIHRIREEEKK